MTGATRVYRLPRKFYEDHAARDLPSGRPGALTGASRYVFVELDQAAYDEILHDAEHYASDQGWDQHLSGLRASARATARRLRGEGPPA